MKFNFKDLASRITGVSIPICGISWNPPETERKIIREVLIYLEDRRALYNDYAWELEREVSDSVLQIRNELTQAIQRLSEKSEAESSLRAMRACCREYLDNSRKKYALIALNDDSMRACCREYLDNSRKKYGGHYTFTLELGKLRALFGLHIAYLAIKYGIDIEGDLASIIPPELREIDYDGDSLKKLEIKND